MNVLEDDCEDGPAMMHEKYPESFGRGRDDGLTMTESAKRVHDLAAEVLVYTYWEEAEVNNQQDYSSAIDALSALKQQAEWLIEELKAAGYTDKE